MGVVPIRLEGEPESNRKPQSTNPVQQHIPVQVAKTPAKIGPVLLGKKGSEIGRFSSRISAEKSQPSDKIKDSDGRRACFSRNGRRESSGQIVVDNGRRGSYGRIGLPTNRRGSYGRIGNETGRRGSNGRIEIDTTVRRGSKGRIGTTENGRRGSFGRIVADTGRRGSCGRKGSFGDINRRGSIGRKLVTGRRGSNGRCVDVKADAAANRRGSGVGPRLLTPKGSRQALKTLQIKICVEGESPEAEVKEEKTQDQPVERGAGVKEILAQDKTEKSVDGGGRWRGVDRGVARVRGGGELDLQPVRQPLQQQSQPANRQNKQVEKDKSQQSLTSFSQFAQDALDVHNKYRRVHAAPPLQLDLKLCRHAQNYANKLASSCSFQHSGDPDYGENLYWAWSSDPNFKLQGGVAVDSWYDESLQSYDYEREPTDTESGHFTQLVWTGSRRLGVGIASTDAGRHIVVMKYDPPGNYVGQYTKHVNKPVS